MQNFDTKNMAARFVILTFFCFPAVFSGCGGKKLPTEFVTGIVTLDDQPLAAARVFFNPKEGGIPAVGVTDENGVYVITAMQGGGRGAGTVAGEYIITVSKPEIIPLKSGRGSETKQLLPLVYLDPAQSPFPATVVKGENHFDVPLKSKPDIKFKAPKGFPGATN